MAKKRKPKSVTRAIGDTGLFYVFHSKYGTIYVKMPSFPAGEIPAHLKSYVEKFKECQAKCANVKGWVKVRTPDGRHVWRTRRQVCIAKCMKEAGVAKTPSIEV